MTWIRPKADFAEVGHGATLATVEADYLYFLISQTSATWHPLPEPPPPGSC